MSNCVPAMLIDAVAIKRVRRIGSLIMDDRAEQLAAVIFPAPRSGVAVAIEDDARGISSHARDRHVGYFDDGRVSRPLDSDGNRERDFVAFELHAGLEHPYVAGEFVDRINGVALFAGKSVSAIEGVMADQDCSGHHLFELLFWVGRVGWFFGAGRE